MRKTKSIKEKLEAIQKRRKKGDYVRIAMKTGYHPSHVRRVLIGERNNTTIVNEAYKTIGRRKVK